MFALGVPYIALSNVGGDSGFVEIFDTLRYMGAQNGVKSMIYLDVADSEKVGPDERVEIVRSDFKCPLRPNSYKYGLGEALTFSMYPGAACTPVDFILTNRKYSVPMLSIPGSDVKARRRLIPVILDVLKVGLDTHDMVNEDVLMMEAAAYLFADRIVFSTQRELQLGIKISRRFLAPSVVRRIADKSIVKGDGLGDILRKRHLSNEEVKKRLQSEQSEIRLAFLGRVTSNKRIDFVIDTVRPLFAMHGLRLTVVTSSDSISKIAIDKDTINFLSRAESRVNKEDFINKFLPSCDVVLNASLHEGFTVTVAESVYCGVPVLLPRKKWAESLVGAEYPFFYRGREELYGKVLYIKKGKVSDSEVTAFQNARRRFENEFASDLSRTIFKVASEEVEKVDRTINKEAHSIIVDAFKKMFPVGEVFSIKDITAKLPGGVRRSRQFHDGFTKYKFIKHLCEPVSAVNGELRRVR